MARCSRSECGKWRPDALVRYTRTGLRVDGAWYCSAACVESATRRRLIGVRRSSAEPTAIPALRVGTLLMHQGGLTSGDLARALGAQQISGRPLGAELLHMGLVNRESILRALAAQAGVSYLASVDSSCVQNAPGGLSIDEVRALGVVPIQLHESTGRLVVACRAPLPRAALSTLRQLTGWTLESLIVSDDDLETLMLCYGMTAPAPRGRMGFVNVHNVDDAAARIASAAASERTIRLREAHSDAASWVRIESLGGVDTLFMQHDQENTECPAAITLH